MRIYIFDLDNTLVNKNCSFKYYSFLNKKKIFSYKDFFRAIKYLVKYLSFKISPTELHEQVFLKFLKGRLHDEIFSHVDEFLDKNFDELINKNVLSFVKEAQKQNDRVIVLSNSPDYLVTSIAKRLNIPEYAGTTYSLDSDRRLDNIVKVMDGEAKAKYCLSIEEEHTEKIVFTDSIWDKPLLDIADTCYIVNPDSKLLKLAKNMSWNIL